MNSTILLAILAALQILDWITTATIIRGGGRELNPVICVLIKTLGLHQALALKCVIAIGLATLLLPHPQILLGLVAAYVVVIVWNLYQLYKQRQLDK